MERLITADDLIRGGACRSGVRRAIDAAFDAGKTLPAAIRPGLAIRMAEDAGEKAAVRKALGLDGDGYGLGYGLGYGDGDGSGDGDGYGDGAGDGYGYGYSLGDGAGDGYGLGSGDGDGDGDGYGSGDGDGYGDGEY